MSALILDEENLTKDGILEHRRKLCKDVPDCGSEWDEMNLAILTDSQRRFRHISESRWSVFDEISVEFVEAVWRRIQARKWVTFHSMLGPASPIYWRSGRSFQTYSVAAKTRYMKNVRMDATAIKDGSQVIDFMADRFASEIDEEVTRDLRNNVGSVAKVESVERRKILDSIVELRQWVGKKVATFHRESDDRKYLPNWAVMSFNTLGMLRDVHHGEDEKDESLFSVASMKIYAEDWFPDGKILIGYKGDEFDSGYQYCPYLLATLGRVWKKDFDARGMNPPLQTDENSDWTLLQRYGKRLVSPDFYGLLTFGEEDHASEA
jgi:hypothetical protein